MISEKSGSGTLLPPGEFISRRTGQIGTASALDRVLQFRQVRLVETEIPDIKVSTMRMCTDLDHHQVAISRCQR